MTFVQLVRPGAPVVLGSLRELDVDAVRRADVRHAGAGARPLRDGRARPPARRPVPLRRQPLRLEDRRTPRPPTSRRRRSARRSSPASTSSSTPPAGSRAGSPSATRSSSSTPTSAGWPPSSSRASTCPRTARRSTRSSRTARASTSSAPPTRSPTSRPRSTAREIADNNSFEQWQEDGVARRRPAGQRDLEADAPRVRGAAARRGHRRGAPRVHRQAQGVDAGLGGLSWPVLFRRRRGARRRRPARPSATSSRTRSSSCCR